MRCAESRPTAIESKPMPSCSIPDDCIDPRRMPLFISRGFLRDLMSTLEPRQIEEESQ